jgi:hypothetical protein
MYTFNFEKVVRGHVRPKGSKISISSTPIGVLNGFTSLLTGYPHQYAEHEREEAPEDALPPGLGERQEVAPSQLSASVEP